MISEAVIKRINQNIFIEENADLFERLVRELKFQKFKNVQERVDNLISNWDKYTSNLKSFNNILFKEVTWDQEHDNYFWSLNNFGVHRIIGIILKSNSPYVIMSEKDTSIGNGYAIYHFYDIPLQIIKDNIKQKFLTFKS